MLLSQPDRHYASLWASLSKRERVIAVRFAEGLTYKQIGEALFIAPATVRAHLAAIYRKLEIHNKIALATLLMDHRLLARARVQEDDAASLEQKGRQQRDNGSQVGPVHPLDTPATRALLQSLGLAQYLPAFRANHIDDALLPALTDHDLHKIGIEAVGHRKRLLQAIAGIAVGNEAAARLTSGGITGSSAERRQLTVMFVDMVGFTTLASRLDPEELHDVLRAYRQAVTGEIARFVGHVAKFMGDGVLAYFGWPLAHEDDTERAIRAGLALTAEVARLPAPGGEPLACRVGIATGVVVVGNLVGEGTTQEEEVLGQTPNLAARLQGLAESGQVVIAESTRLLLGDIFALKDLGSKSVKGIGEPVQTFAVTAERPSESRFEARSGPPSCRC